MGIASLPPHELKKLESQGFALETIVDGEDPSLQLLGLRDLQNPAVYPLAVDFLSGRMGHRLKYGLGKGQPLPRALGMKSLKAEGAPFVLDATAGLGIDAFVMASMGCRVRAIERSPVVYALLADGYQRLLAAAEKLTEEAGDTSLLETARRLSFECGDARAVLGALVCVEPKSDDGPRAFADRPDVVYLDPMYPEEGRSKSALPKKGMQIFRRLIGDDFDASELLPSALRAARSRVVVKRPLSAPHLAGELPTHVFEGKTSRYDMYIVKSRE